MGKGIGEGYDIGTGDGGRAEESFLETPAAAVGAPAPLSSVATPPSASASGELHRGLSGPQAGRQLREEWKRLSGVEARAGATAVREAEREVTVSKMSRSFVGAAWAEV